MNSYRWSEAVVRRRAEKKTNKQIPEGIWQFFIKNRSVSQVRQDPKELGWLVSEIKDLMIAAELSSKAAQCFRRRKRREGNAEIKSCRLTTTRFLSSSLSEREATKKCEGSESFIWSEPYFHLGMLERGLTHRAACRTMRWPFVFHARR